MALTKEDLQAIAALMDSKLEPINERLDTIQEDIEQIKEDTAITREVTNGLGEWAEVVADVLKVRYPIEKQ